MESQAGAHGAGFSLKMQSRIAPAGRLVVKRLRQEFDSPKHRAPRAIAARKFGRAEMLTSTEALRLVEPAFIRG